MKEFEEVIARIQTSIPNFTANYRCHECLNKEGIPTEEEIQMKKKERMRKRCSAGCFFVT
jgi:DNA-directed RNA polymerase alpha subunit